MKFTKGQILQNGVLTMQNFEIDKGHCKRFLVLYRRAVKEMFVAVTAGKIISEASRHFNAERASLKIQLNSIFPEKHIGNLILNEIKDISIKFRIVGKKTKTIHTMDHEILVAIIPILGKAKKSERKAKTARNESHGTIISRSFRELAHYLKDNKLVTTKGKSSENKICDLVQSILFDYKIRVRKEKGKGLEEISIRTINKTLFLSS